MRFDCARQAWHDAFTDDVSAIDPADALTKGVQFTAKGSGNKIVDHCEKGKVQVAVHQLKQADPVAAAWGMFAYAPDDKCNGSERGMVFGWLVDEFNRWDRETKCLDLNDAQVKMLARLAMHSEARADSTSGQYKQDMVSVRRAIRCRDMSEWEANWKPVWRKMRQLCGKLPARALTPVAVVVYEYREKLELEKVS